ncbi:7tm odorant receptor domain-containing protein [Phthorimaea operculella]|nr:7tm odorant receptor domain-containing protein [Phthorimaea operculella]
MRNRHFAKATLCESDILPKRHCAKTTFCDEYTFCESYITRLNSTALPTELRAPSGPWFRAEDKVLSIKYVTWLRLYLWPIGFWPGNELNEGMPVFIILHRYCNILQCLLLSFGTLNFVHKYFDTMDVFHKSHACLSFLLNLLWLKHKISNFIYSMADTEKLQALCALLGYFFWVGRVNKPQRAVIIASEASENFYAKNERKSLKAREKQAEKYTYREQSELDFSRYNQVRSINTSLMDTHDFGIISTIVTIYLTLPFTISVNGLDLLLMLMAFHIIGNILVLRKRLETLSPRKINFKNEIFDEEIEDVVPSLAFTKQENKIIHEKLVDCIKYQNMIIMFTKMVSNVFGPMLEFDNVFHVTACCLLLLACSDGFRFFLRTYHFKNMQTEQLSLWNMGRNMKKNFGPPIVNQSVDRQLCMTMCFVTYVPGLILSISSPGARKKSEEPREGGVSKMAAANHLLKKSYLVLVAGRASLVSNPYKSKPKNLFLILQEDHFLKLPWLLHWWNPENEDAKIIIPHFKLGSPASHTVLSMDNNGDTQLRADHYATLPRRLRRGTDSQLPREHPTNESYYLPAHTSGNIPRSSCLGIALSAGLKVSVLFFLGPQNERQW